MLGTGDGEAGLAWSVERGAWSVEGSVGRKIKEKAALLQADRNYSFLIIIRCKQRSWTWTRGQRALDRVQVSRSMGLAKHHAHPTTFRITCGNCVLSHHTGVRPISGSSGAHHRCCCTTVDLSTGSPSCRRPVLPFRSLSMSMFPRKAPAKPRQAELSQGTACASSCRPPRVPELEHSRGHEWRPPPCTHPATISARFRWMHGG